MRGNSHVRFGAGDEETYLGDGARRFIPTLPNSTAHLFLSEAADRGAVGQEGRKGRAGGSCYPTLAISLAARPSNSSLASW